MIRWIPSAVPIAMSMTGMNDTTSVMGLPASPMTPSVHTSATSTTDRGMNTPLSMRKERYMTTITTRITIGVSLDMSRLMYCDVYTLTIGTPPSWISSGPRYGPASASSRANTFSAMSKWSS